MKKIKIKFRKLVCVSLFIIAYTIQVEAQTNEYFKTTWNTEIGDSSNVTNSTIVLPILPIYGASYDVDVNNDGDFDDTGDLTNLKGTITIDFGTPGIYTIAVRPNPTNNTSKQLRISHGNSGDTPEKLMSIDKWGDIVWTSMSNAFQDCSNMILADDAGVPDLTMVTSMWNAFNGATNFNGNISTWNVSAVTDMGWVFSNATSFNQDIGDWNVSAVTDMSWMFSSADDFNQDIGDWNVSAVTDMRLMFSSADDFNQDIGDWNVSAVTSMGLMFNGASSFTSENYDALLIGWSNLIPQRGISFGAPPTTYCLGEAGREILINTYNWYITGDMGLSCPVAPFVTTWNTELGDPGNATIELPITVGVYDVDVNNDGDFDDAEDKINQRGTITIDFVNAGIYSIAVRPNPTNNTSKQLRISHYDEVNFRERGTPKKLTSIDKWGDIVWTSMETAFDSCSNMTFADNVGVPDLSMVTSMWSTFSGATSFNGDLSTWNVSNVTSMAGTFHGATNFNGDLSSWNVSNVIYMRSTFSGATSFNGNISNWNVSNVIYMAATFRGATNFNGDLSSWNVSNVKFMNSMFSGATSFNGNISTWNVSNVTNMYQMFREASSFNGDLSNWNVSNVTDMRNTFRDATSFNGDLSSWNVSNVSNAFRRGGMDSMFSGATSFSSENYDSLLTEWAKLALQDDINFGAPPTTYCSGKAGRDILINTYNWTIQGDNGLDCTAVTSVDDEFLSNTKIYPNSTNGKINIESSFTIDKLELYNVLGAKLFSVSKTNVLDLAGLRQGVYILKVFSEDRAISKKIIKD